MNAKSNDGGAAFPYFHGDGTHGISETGEGMSLRDWFAGMTVASGNYCGLSMNETTKQNATKTARYAYMVADAMLKAREVPHV